MAAVEVGGGDRLGGDDSGEVRRAAELLDAANVQNTAEQVLAEGSLTEATGSPDKMQLVCP